MLPHKEHEAPEFVSPNDTNNYKLEAINIILEKNPRLRQEYERPRPGTERLFKAEVTHDSRGCAAFCAKEPSNLV
ncbi:hypothetical protein TOPH_03514 [Tolypocladium ophioglossoides CBS 100239]|uniref:Uncharacterized protein n=1 Tax=Tolypocladium ophioglossoides (strain CBS 100239) TaxID=1163406 RepID=A0A0L0ND19_TOLOC|nr:hypothetical protein TOPH_03514 [Tolypocladium ophioglossoides CBS 100239]